MPGGLTWLVGTETQIFEYVFEVRDDCFLQEISVYFVVEFLDLKKVGEI